MIDQTFLCCFGVGPVTQKKIYEHGVKNWQQYLQFSESLPLSGKLRKNIEHDVKNLQAALDACDYTYLAKRFPVREHWRLLLKTIDQASYFDIETSGLSPENATITVIACLHKGVMHRFVAGENLDEFVDLLEDITTLISFNGSSFDVPWILNQFHLPDVDCLHLDLRWICYHLGLVGGLKAIEKKMGLQRPEGVIGLSGSDAVQLWERWAKKRDERAKKILINYCCEDVYSLEKISQKIVNNFLNVLH